MTNVPLTNYKSRKILRINNQNRLWFQFDTNIFCLTNSESANKVIRNFHDAFVFIFSTIKRNPNENPLVLFDLRNIKEFSFTGRLALYAFISNCRLRTLKLDIIKIILPESETAAKDLEKSGFLDASQDYSVDRLNARWDRPGRYMSGYDPDKHIDPLLNILDQELKGALPEELKSAITEATLNVVDHAYKNVTENPSLKDNHLVNDRWWIHYEFDTKASILNFAITDQGFGIPKTFKDDPTLKALSNAERIEYAMINGNTSMNETKHGKGSKNIKRPVERSKTDTLTILSWNGLYEYNKETEEPKLQDLKNLDDAGYIGTLLAWSIEI
ncbi:hypothetical protein [Pseudoalteromonas spongiae]|uniref:hypothetical protein n=1 Tax=Pseudoalteromonas spongiae TaxID=298657 RepID=UPI00110B5FBF|nr:hypothetical protein [Pseudoalteromonas spongiae]TMO84210.1 hypothetical protein CWC15_11425 [Pseudoalteromonas spongiae]